MLASVLRHNRSRHARGCAPLAWYLLFATGLRHAEIQPPGPQNPYGGLKWRDVILDGDHPGIWTDPKWIGNKSKRRAWLPLTPHLTRMLREYQDHVIPKPDDSVFGYKPTNATFHRDRKGAGLPAADPDGRPLSVHSTRASFITWLGQSATVPDGLRQVLARHQTGLTEATYTTRSKAEMAAAVAMLPAIWPDGIQMRAEPSQATGGATDV